jgi:hypothetical protein
MEWFFTTMEVSLARTSIVVVKNINPSFKRFYALGMLANASRRL